MWSAIPVALLCIVVNGNERQGSGPEGSLLLLSAQHIMVIEVVLL